jgi:hypothetical protein
MSRYSDILTIKNSEGKRFYPTTKYPDIPLSENDAYILCSSTDRYDKLAETYYGDSSLWWVISIANNASSQNSLFPPLDTYIRIPENYLEVITKFNTLNKSSNNPSNPSNIGTY